MPGNGYDSGKDSPRSKSQLWMDRSVMTTRQSDKKRLKEIKRRKTDEMNVKKSIYKSVIAVLALMTVSLHTPEAAVQNSSKIPDVTVSYEMVEQVPYQASTLDNKAKKIIKNMSGTIYLPRKICHIISIDFAISIMMVYLK